MTFRIYIFVCYYLLINLLERCTSSRVIVRRHAGVADDLPLQYDLQDYIDSLKKIIEFTSEHKLDLDLNYLFGMFLLQVNLKIAVKSQNSLTESVSNETNAMLVENEKLLKYFKFRVDTDFNIEDSKDKSIAKLFENCKKWSQRVPRLRLRRRRMSSRHLAHTAADLRWSEYRASIDKFDKWTPNPKQSDFCIASLGDIEDKVNYYHKCKVDGVCRDMLINGSDFGYALLHRLLFLQSARYGRGCSIFSPPQDDDLRNKFCSIAYGEAELIAQHGFNIADLLFEQVSLCALDGHVEFLRRSWLSKLLEHQSTLGCFGYRPQQTLYVETKKAQTWRISKQNHQLLGGHCNGHFTSVAAATLAAAVRFILENY